MSEVNQNSSGRLYALVGHFQRCRWSETRKRIDALVVGEYTVFPAKEFNNITTTIQRLQEAYEDTRRWTMKRNAAGIRVKRIAPNGGDIWHVLKND